MIRVTQIKVLPDADKNVLTKKAAKILGIRETEIKRLEIVKQSIDARKKPEIYYSYVVDVELTASKAQEEKLVKKCKNGQASVVTEEKYCFPTSGTETLKHRPVIVGMGPAGLFCGYFLAKHGYSPILLERGKDVDARTRDVQEFWETGRLRPDSNVQFGEGGAGTFSDGKLNTLVKDKYGRNREVLRVLVEYGAPEKIMYDAKPHIGTDVLTEVVRNIRQAIIDFGGEVHFETEMLELAFEGAASCGTALQGIRIREKGAESTLACDQVVLAIGHSARNTFETLYRQQVPMEAKSFAVGMRVEHPQAMINESQYGMADAGILGAAPYKVTARTGCGRGVYSFCMCPGGYVVNASSEEGRLAVNGMSYSDRGSANANSAIIVAVTPEDFGSNHPLAGVEFQRTLEEKAFVLGQGRIPVQRYGDFKACVEGAGETPEKCFGETDGAEATSAGGRLTSSRENIFSPCTRGAYTYADVSQILPPECNQAFVEGMDQFGRMIKGFNRPDALLLGVESRTSSPVRIHRDESLQSQVRGLYPCGEGAGYAGGITSAAMDGLKVAEEIARRYRSE